jgi:23S rRNA (adenine2503-C2)-methyltransferase
VTEQQLPVLSLSGTGTRRTRPPRHFADLGPEERKAAVAELGLPGFRADQIARQYYSRFEADPAAMTDLPAADRDAIGTLFPQLFEPTSVIDCDGGATRKTLWRAVDGALVESVLMGYRDRATVCISSQAGCGMACPFCATGQGGLQRNMSTAEIVEQVRVAAASARDGDLGEGIPARLSNIVFMGMGEPLANYRRVVDAVHRICDPAPDGLGISQRSVTVSTVGLVPAIHRLADEGLQVTLAVSLHTPDDELRDTLVPVNTRWPVREVLEAARHYSDVTGRRVSIEYALIRDVNDQPWRADLLAKILSAQLGRLVHVNLIPLNPTPGSKWDASPAPVQAEFVRRVRNGGVACTVRDTRGREIAAACGQLAAGAAEPSPAQTSPAIDAATGG